MKHTIGDLNNIHKIYGIQIIFIKAITCTDRQTEFINTFKLCWKVFKKWNFDLQNPMIYISTCIKNRMHKQIIS